MIDKLLAEVRYLNAGINFMQDLTNSNDNCRVLHQMQVKLQEVIELANKLKLE